MTRFYVLIKIETAFRGILKEREEFDVETFKRATMPPNGNKLF